MGDEVVTYRIPAGLFVGSSIWATLGVLCLIGSFAMGSVVLVTGSLLTTATGAIVAAGQCSRIELHPDGTLIVRYRIRPRNQGNVTEITKIWKHREAGTWTVLFENRWGDWSFQLSDSNAAESFVHSLRRRRPDIRIAGYTVPPL